MQAMGSCDDALARHRSDVDAVLQSGDAAAIKRLYVELGDLLEGAIGDDVDQTPVLSLPETEPVVCGLLAGVGGRLLDAGCGPNPRPAISLAREDPSRQIVAVDIGLGTVRLARTVAAREGVALLAVVADLEALPFRDGAFAGGLCDDTIEHVPRDDVAARELARILTGDGLMVIATPNRHSAEVLWRKVADRLARRPQPAAHYYAATSHLREYTWPELEQLMRPAFRIRDRAAVGWQGGWKRRLASQLTSRWPLRRWARMVVVAVQPRRSH
jgi:SAM-dependent methyltransferase